MVASIGAVLGPAQCVACFGRGDYYAKDSTAPPGVEHLARQGC